MKTVLDREDLIFSLPQLGCVLYLPGLPGGGSKIYDRSPYGNVGTIVGATWKRLPSGLWCLSFDGNDDYVDCGNDESLLIADEITVVVWIKPSSVDAWDGILGNYNHTNHKGYNFWFSNDANRNLVFQRSDNGAAVTDPSARIIALSTWSQVGFTFRKDG